MGNSDAGHVRVLWCMKRVKRLQVWHTLGRFQEVEELHLGGEHRCPCPVDVEELMLLLPEGAGALATVRKLDLFFCAGQVDDGFLCALASAGCGQNLTSVSLAGECLFVDCVALLLPLLRGCASC